MLETFWVCADDVFDSKRLHIGDSIFEEVPATVCFVGPRQLERLGAYCYACEHDRYAGDLDLPGAG